MAVARHRNVPEPYFPSIDRNILTRLLARRLRDERLLEVIHAILESGAGLYTDPELRAAARLDADWPPPERGLPIGSATSQLFAAHVYLAALDHFVKRELRVGGYVRYVDDLFLFGERRSDLRAWRRGVAAWLWRERGLLLKRPGAPVLSCRGTLDALGYRLRRQGLEPRPRAYRRLERRTRQALLGNAEQAAAFERSLEASKGLLLF